jgi:uncharacterized protein (TIGR03790 family)
VRLFSESSVRCAVILFTALCLPAARSQTPQQVLVVYNTNYADSLTVANHYMTARNIPSPANLCAITPPANDGLSLSDYTTSVKTPIQNCLNNIGSKNILYIVMSYLTPYEVAAGPFGIASVDSYLADIWDKYVSQPFLVVPNITQPYYNDSQSQGNVYVPFQTFASYRANSRNPLIYSVWRLDGPTEAIASALVDQAMQAETQGGPSGQACIDRMYGSLTGLPDIGYYGADWDLHQASTFLQQAGVTVVEDANPQTFGTAPAPLTCPDTAFYAGWYNYGVYNNAFSWQTGAIGWDLDSDAATYLRSGPTWVPNALNAPALGFSQNGITVTTGPVAEPYVQGMVRPGAAYRNLLEGANVGDAFLRNTRWLKWQIVYIGDPLYKPFGAGRYPFSPLQPVNSFQISPQEIVGGTNTTGTLTLNSAAPAGGTSFTLSGGSGISLPATVTVAGGAKTVNFPITTAVVTQSASTILTATSGALSLDNTIVVDPLLGSLSTTQAAPATMAGIPVAVTAVLNGRAPTGGALIGLSSDNAAVTVPASVTVPAGSTVANFTATTTPVSQTVTADITAIYANTETVLSIAVVPAISLVSPVATTLNPGAETLVYVELGIPVPTGYSATVQLTSSDPASLTVPSSITIPAGSQLGTFIAVSSTGAPPEVVTITAVYGGSTVPTNVTIN